MLGALPARAQYIYDVLNGFEPPPSYPQAALVKGADGALYGTTRFGGTSGYGTVFKINEDGTGFAKLHDFDYTSGSRPYAALEGAPVAAGAVLAVKGGSPGRVAGERLLRRAARR